jgi:uncharacterized protein
MRARLGAGDGVPGPAGAGIAWPGSAARARRSRARLTLAVLITATALLLCAGLVEPGWIELTRHVLGRPHADGRPLRVVQLSDLHLSSVGERERRAAALVRSERPDLVVITGDLVESDEALPQLDAFLSLLGEPPAILAIPGNRERSEAVRLGPMAATLARHRGQLLVNEVLEGVHQGHRYAVAGLDYPTGALSRRDAAVLARSANRLVLAHSPAARDSWAGPAATAMLAGHTHGGQIAPFGVALWLPPGCDGYAAGWFRGGKVDLYVSRGVGTSMVPFRLGARPEVAVFDWWLD